VENWQGGSPGGELKSKGMTGNKLNGTRLGNKKLKQFQTYNWNQPGWGQKEKKKVCEGHVQEGSRGKVRETCHQGKRVVW